MVCCYNKSRYIRRSKLTDNISYFIYCFITSDESLVCSTDGINAKVEIEYNWSVIIDDENNRLLKNMQVYREGMEFKGYKWNDNSNCYSDITISYDEFIEAIK